MENFEAYSRHMANQYSLDMGAKEAQALREKLQSMADYMPAERQYALFCFEGEGVQVAYYAKRGKLVVQGRGAEAFVKDTLHMSLRAVEKNAGAGSQNAGFVDTKPHFGVDESGKGDYFGPLVVAGVYTDERTAHELLRLGCKDSKQISSYEQIGRLAAKIKELPGVEWELLCIGPARYNEIYADMGNLNRLLAWGHARVIAALHAKVPACPRALSDQFANEWVLRRALAARAVPVKLEQRPRAEEDVAVAAASILARARFVEWLQQAARAAGCKLPLGCAPHVLQAAKEFVRTHGRERLAEVAKLHFKLTKQL